MKYDLVDYLFDLKGCAILKSAVSMDLVAQLNRCLDSFPALPFKGWHGNVQRLDNNGDAGIELQNIVEAGAPFEQLIDHPSWIERVKRYCGEEGTYVEGLFIDECFASIRRTGGFFPIHSGGQDGIVRNQFRYIGDRFRCGQVNMLLALTDIGPGDGGTLVIPGSPKSNLTHPGIEAAAKAGTNNQALIEGAIEIHLKKGDVLLFVDAICHGASERTNPGERRAVIYRYGPSWSNTRHGYRYSDELLARLNPERLKILQPIPPRAPPKK